MSFEEFLTASAPPEQASAPLQALWHDAHGGWERAHALVQSDTGSVAAWVHAYLHRREGDEANAGYWYARAGRKPPARTITLDAERAAIGQELIAGQIPNSGFRKPDSG